MKTLALLLASLGVSLAQLPPWVIPKTTTPVTFPQDPVPPMPPAAKVSSVTPVAEIVSEPSAARHFEVTVHSSTEAGSLAEGGFFELAPGTVLPPEKKPTLLDRVPPGPVLTPLQKTWNQMGTIYIRGLNTEPDGAPWKGMLERDGIFRQTVDNVTRTVPAYKLVTADDPVVAYQKSLKPEPPGTLLDKGPHR